MSESTRRIKPKPVWRVDWSHCYRAVVRDDPARASLSPRWQAREDASQHICAECGLVHRRGYSWIMNNSHCNPMTGTRKGHGLVERGRHGAAAFSSPAPG